MTRRRTIDISVAALDAKQRGEEGEELFEDLEESTELDPDEETAFDDVAMILLLFFMVTSLLVVISPEPENPTKEQPPFTAERADPSKLFKGVSHRMLIAPGPEGGVMMYIAGIGPADDGKHTIRGPFLTGGTEEIEYEFEDFRDAFTALLSDQAVPPASGGAGGESKPVYLVNHFGHDNNADLALATWWALAKIAKDKELKKYTSKVRFTRWRAQLKE